MGKLNVFLFLLILVNISWAQNLTIISLSEDLNENVTVTENFDEINQIETTITIVVEEELETAEATSQQETTTEENIVEGDITTNSLSESETTTVPPAPVCTTSGLQAEANNCQLYHECSSEGSTDGTLQPITKSCPEKEAFSTQLKRCSRDISSCPLDVQCVSTGSIPDPASNYSYYYCQEHYIGSGFYIFHISCEYYEVYSPRFGRCAWDFLTLHLPLRDKDVYKVRRELKLIKEKYKVELKKIEEQKKAEEKLRKQQEKEAREKEEEQKKAEEKLRKYQQKEAKEKERREKKKMKEDLANIECVEEENFASQVSDNIYIACIKKKNKFKAVYMKCGADATFDHDMKVCVTTDTDEDSDED